jgi:Zn finger protein HypA/HybF involved in hydrogenase expression
VKITNIKPSSFTAKCPHCQRDLPEIYALSKGWLIQHTLYACPHCRSVLAIGYNVGT